MGNSAATREALLPEDFGGVPTTSSDLSGTSLAYATDDRPQILYALVARSVSEAHAPIAAEEGQHTKEVLCDYSAYKFGDDVEGIVHKYLQSFVVVDNMKSYIFGEKQAIHYIVDDSLWFVCLADKAIPRQKTFACLEVVKHSYTQHYSSGWVATIENANKFRNEIEKCVTHWNSPDRAAALKEQVDQVHDIVLESIDNLMAREEKIEELADRSRAASDAARQFQRGSVALYKRIQWRNIRSYIILAVLVLLVIFIIILMSCGGFSFKDC